MYKTLLQFSSCLYAPLFCLALASCGHSAGEIADIVSERDSLRNETQKQQRQLKNMNEMVDVVNGSLISIVTEQNNLFNAGTVEGGPATKEQVLENITKLENLITQQKSRIEQLEKELEQQEKDGDTDDSDSKLALLVKALKEQIAKKDAEIAKLKEDLKQKNVDIANLQAQAARQSQTIVELDRRANMQQEALKRQDAMLNQCYMVIATKSELQNRGIIKKGKLVTKSALDRSKFSKVDIRKLTEITFQAKKPKLLTSMPESSYEITTDGNHNFTLHIKNPNSFWSISNFLVIQTN